MSERPTKRVFIPQPPTEGEQLAWQVADANAKSMQHINAQLTAAQSRVKELEQCHDVAYVQAIKRELDDLTADNARLRESIQSVLCYAHLPQRYRDELEAAIERPHDAT